jgi:hypothetical protein
MKHTVCFIDDKIPVAQFSEYFNDTDIISGSVIKYLLKQKTTNWEDDVVKKMCEKLLKEPAKWSVSAFTSPAFYSNYIQDNIYSPEIVIYDWDYNWGPGGNQSEEYLLEILQHSYTMIFVFSEQDNIEAISQVIKKNIFKRYKSRLKVVDKNHTNSIKTIVSQITAKEINNFSFAYGQKVIFESNKAINKTLSDISLLSVEDYFASISSKEENGAPVFTKYDFIEAIIPRYKKELVKVDWADTPVKKVKPKIKEIKAVWAHRLYDNTSSEKVLMGDIVYKANGRYYLVVSSDCHIEKFWKKNGGYISLVPLLKIKSQQGKEQLKLMLNNQTKITSLTNSQSAMTILPAVPIKTKFFDFVLLPKGIISVKITRGDNTNEQTLKYDTFIGFSKVASILDPFKSPLIQFIMDNISGYGCPDFPPLMQNDLKDKIKEARK